MKNQRTNRLTILLTKKERAELEKKAELMGLSVSAYIRVTLISK